MDSYDYNTERVHELLKELLTKINSNLKEDKKLSEFTNNEAGLCREKINILLYQNNKAYNIKIIKFRNKKDRTKFVFFIGVVNMVNENYYHRNGSKFSKLVWNTKYWKELKDDYINVYTYIAKLNDIFSLNNPQIEWWYSKREL